MEQFSVFQSSAKIAKTPLIDEQFYRKVGFHSAFFRYFVTRKGVSCRHIFLQKTSFGERMMDVRGNIWHCIFMRMCRDDKAFRKRLIIKTLRGAFQKFNF